MAGLNLQHGPLSHPAEQVKTLEVGGDRIELRAVTGPGRIWNHELVAAVMKIAGDGDTRWCLSVFGAGYASVGLSAVSQLARAQQNP